MSSFGVGGRFLQDDQPVAFDSNTLQVTEQFSAVTGKESLAVYLGFNLSLKISHTQENCFRAFCI